jgi:hypothetical protein
MRAGTSPQAKIRPPVGEPKSNKTIACIGRCSTSIDTPGSVVTDLPLLSGFSAYSSVPVVALLQLLAYKRAGYAFSDVAPPSTVTLTSVSGFKDEFIPSVRMAVPFIFDPLRPRKVNETDPCRTRTLSVLAAPASSALLATMFSGTGVTAYSLVTRVGFMLGMHGCPPGVTGFMRISKTFVVPGKAAILAW